MKLRYFIPALVIVIVAGFSILQTQTVSNLVVGSGTIRQLSQWILSSDGYVKTASSTAKLWVPGLGSSGDCVVTDANGKMSTATCGTGSGSDSLPDFLSQIGDVSTTSLATNDVLYYNGTSWVPTATSSWSLQMGGTAASDLDMAGYDITAVNDITANGNVGIGTANPTSKLDIRGVTGTDVALSIGADATSGVRPQLRIYGYGDSAGHFGYGSIYYDTWGRLTLDAGTTRVTDTFNAGNITLTGSQMAKISAPNFVAFSMQSSPTYSRIPAFAFGKDTDVWPAPSYYTNPRLYVLSASQGDKNIYLEHNKTDGVLATGEGGIIFNPAGITAMRIDSGGNVGINTTSPGAKLQTNSDAYGWPVTSGTTQTYAGFRIGSSEGNAVLDAGIYTSRGAWFQVTNETSLGTAYPLILNPNGGNIGIGTTLPDSKLTVDGGALQISSGDTYKSVIIKDGNGNKTFRGLRAGAYWDDLPSNSTAFQVGDSGDNIVFTTASSIIAPRIMMHTEGFQVNGGDFAGATAPAGLFEVTNGATKLFDILSNGNVGIGTTSPAAKLSVVGDFAVTDLANCDTIDTNAWGQFTCGTDDGGSGTSPWTDGGSFVFPTNGETVNVLALTASSTTATSTYNLFNILNMPTVDTTAVNFNTRWMQFGPTQYPSEYVPSCDNCSYLVMDKDATADDTSVVLRDQGNARAEIGLVGDNHIRFKTATSTFGDEAFSTRMIVWNSGQDGTGNVGIGTGETDQPLALLSVGQDSAFQVNYAGDLTASGSISILRDTGSAVLTLESHQASGEGSYIKLRDDTLGNFAYFGQNSVINGGTAYDQFSIQNPQPTGTVCISAGGRASATGGTNCDIFIDDATASTTINMLSVGTAFNFLGDYITSTATWFLSKLQAISSFVAAASSTWDFGGATALEIVNGTNPTVTTTGDIALDTTDNQLLMADSGGTARVVGMPEFQIVNTTIASTSLAFMTGANLPVGSNKDGLELTQYRCWVEGGTSYSMRLTDGTNNTETITCGTSVTSDTNVATNDTFTANEKMYLDFVTESGTVNYVHFQAWARITRE